MDKNVSSIFKAYDVRGKVGEELTEQVVKDIGRSLADWLPNQGVVAVGRDMRPDSAQLAAALIEGLKQQGRDVWDIGQVTSDMIYFAVGKNGLAGGAVITASHNPGQYNGIKLCREEAKPIGEETGLFAIRDAVLNGDFKPSDKTGQVTEKDITEGWLEHVLGFINVNKLKPLKVVVDAGNGMAGKIFAELEPYIPFNVIEMYFELDGTFPNHIANPLEPENLKDLIKSVKSNQADAGIAFDGDGDRAVLIDEKGVALSGSVMTAILAKYFLGKKPSSTILHNAITGRIVPATISANGGTAVRTRVGHSFIKNEMRQNNAIFAGEHSGHYYFADNYMADSGLIAAMVALAVLSDSGKKLSQLADEFRKGFSINETNFEVADKQSTINKIAENFKGAEVDWLDGLTLNFNDGWINVRPSNTEPLLRLNAEFDSQNRLNEMVEKATELIEG